MATAVGTRRRARGEREQDREARRDRICAAAVLLFQEKGYYATTIDEVAEAAALNKATLYRYFRSKEDILYRIYQQFMEVIVSRTGEVATGPGRALDKLGALIRAGLTINRDYRPYIYVVLREDYHLSTRRLAAINRKRKAYSASIDQVIQQGIEGGEFRNLDPHLMKLAMVGMYTWSFHWLDPNGRLSIDQIAEAFTDIALHGIARPQS